MEDTTTSSHAGTSKRPFPPLGTPFPVIQDPSFQMPVPRFPQSPERPRRPSRPATASIVERSPLFALLDPSTSSISSGLQVRVRSPFLSMFERKRPAAKPSGYTHSNPEPSECDGSSSGEICGKLGLLIWSHRPSETPFHSLCPDVTIPRWVDFRAQFHTSWF